MNDWNIQSRAHACQVSGHHFADKEPFYTLLYQDKHELKRLDVAIAAWTPEFSAEVLARKGYISHWKGIYEAPPPAPPEAIQKDTAETLLRSKSSFCGGMCGSTVCAGPPSLRGRTHGRRVAALPGPPAARRVGRYASRGQRRVRHTPLSAA